MVPLNGWCVLLVDEWNRRCGRGHVALTAIKGADALSDTHRHIWEGDFRNRSGPRGASRGG
jgi:hypothetical protein